MALFYPIAAALIGWVFGGKASVGGLPFGADDIPFLQRLLSMILIFAAGFLMY